MIAIAPGLFYRHLTVAEVKARQRARHVREIAAHNAAVTASAEPRPPTREQVLEEFPALTRRWAKAQ